MRSSRLHHAIFCTSYGGEDAREYPAYRWASTAPGVGKEGDGGGDDDDDDDTVPIDFVGRREEAREATRLFARNIARGGTGEPAQTIEEVVVGHARDPRATFEALASIRVSPPIREVIAPMGPVRSGGGEVGQVEPSRRGELGQEGEEGDEALGFGQGNDIPEAYVDSDLEAYSTSSLHADEEVS